jgi:hypothetical protein
MHMATHSLSRKISARSILPWLIMLGIFGLIVGIPLAIVLNVWREETKGPYTYTTSLADLNNDGRQDVILHIVRHEAVSTAWGGTTLWTNGDGVHFSSGGLPPLQPLLYITAAGLDVDGDGDPDILLANPDGLSLVQNQGSLQGGQAGSFKLNNSINGMGWLANYTTIAIGDLNNDGKPDAFVSGCCGIPGMKPGEDAAPSYAWVWINAWSVRDGLKGSSLKIAGLEGVPIRAVALGDLDGDGDLDAFAAVQAHELGQPVEGGERVLLNDGAGVFSDSGQRLGNRDSTCVALGDTDGDGDLDALVGTTQGAVLWINQGGAQGGQPGAFAAAPQTIATGAIKLVYLSDFNQDGHADALVGGEQRAEIWWNDGQGSFKPSGQRFDYTERHGLSVGDFNGDSRPDIFAAAYGQTQTYSLWLNQGEGTFSLAK